MAAGLLAVERGEAAEAVPLLEQASRSFAAMRNGNPYCGANVDRAHAYLALAHAALGDRAEAKRHYRIAEPRLWALKSKDLRRRCEEAIGLLADGGARPVGANSNPHFIAPGSR